MSQFPYISPSDFANYGIPDASASQVDVATRLVNNYLNRPEGILWVKGADGFPCYMAWKEPTLSLSLPAPIAAGANVQINIPNGGFGLQNIGEMVILDRANSGVVEACLISGATRNSITLQSVQFPHDTGACIDFGMTIVDELALPNGRTTVMVTRTPMVRLQSGYGRYGQGRRSQQFAGADVSSNLLAYVAAFGGPPQWTQFDVNDVDVNTSTGTLWCPPGLLLAYFSDVRLHYCAGWQINNVPSNIKQAVANLVRQAIDLPYGPSAKLVKAGNATIQRFGNTLIDDDTKAILDPYKAKFFS